MNGENPQGIITPLSVMTGKPESYFEVMEERRLVDEYDRLLEIN